MTAPRGWGAHSDWAADPVGFDSNELADAASPAMTSCGAWSEQKRMVDGAT
jgi:hypothetical protein